VKKSKVEGKSGSRDDNEESTGTIKISEVYKPVAAAMPVLSCSGDVRCASRDSATLNLRFPCPLIFIFIFWHDFRDFYSTADIKALVSEYVRQKNLSSATDKRLLEAYFSPFCCFFFAIRLF
jgi:hypothetical protein